MTTKLARILWTTLLVTACSASPPTQAPNQATPTPRTFATIRPTPIVTVRPEPTMSSDPLDQMEIAFDGGYTRAEIKAALDKAFAIYDLERTNDNYIRAGSVLVALRQDATGNGCEHCTEMEILRAMSVDGGFPGLDFPEAAAWAVTAIRVLE